MGAKTALLAFADGDLRPALRAAVASDPAEAEAAVRQALPGYEATPAGDSTLGVTWPPDDVTHVAALPGATVLCDRRLVLDRPSELPEHLLRLGAGRRIVMHGMHSVVDGLCFHVVDPTGREQAARAAAYEQAMRAMGPPRRFRPGPDGTLAEVTP
ncbi:hypothetical protein GA0070622_0652 [Micromonospora sediminicola]|uniref:Uncharacterized protein n=1 Tax=Micromonospora sediminicola TaxID=946078 RepID=A0A1A9B3T9_9ACTN|nr:hypothetical protein [Micromonospora sediminicola]SBT63694.1 hypothetical protein GA0070622_0652 [Micromonospora sediminicola]